MSEASKTAVLFRPSVVEVRVSTLPARESTLLVRAVMLDSSVWSLQQFQFSSAVIEL